MLQGFGIVSAIEAVDTNERDQPVLECVIEDCGELPAGTDLARLLAEQVLQLVSAAA